MKNTTYEAPQLSLVGTLETLTQGSATGNRTDAMFPTTTPVSQLTFS